MEIVSYCISTKFTHYLCVFIKNSSAMHKICEYYFLKNNFYLRLRQFQMNEMWQHSMHSSYNLGIQHANNETKLLCDMIFVDT
jgi:hypothetical protein